MENNVNHLSTLKNSDFRKLLQEELIARCRKNQSYSLRSFARYLGVSHSALTEMINGKRPITKKSIEKIGIILGLGISDIQHYQQSSIKDKTENENKNLNYHQLTLDQFALISDWYHFAILELIKINHCTHTASYFSRALGITKSEANIAIERLLRIGLLELDENGKYFETNNGFATNISGNLTSIGAKRLQKQILEQSIEALMSLPVEVRNHTSMTMAIDPKLLPQAIEKIKKFRRELSDFLETEGTPTEVYQLSLSLFPVTHLKSLEEQ